jgi:hypothetical protein
MLLDDLGFNPIPSRFAQGRLYAFSGRGSIGIIPDTVTGIGPFFFPPVSGKYFQCYHRLILPDLNAVLGDSATGTHYTPHRLLQQSIEWLPWRIRRRGLFHHHVGSRLLTLRVTHDLIAPADGDGILVRLELELLSPRALRVEIHPDMDNAGRAFGVCTAAAWNYEVPAAEGIVWSEGPRVWRTDGCTMTAREDDPAFTLHRGQPFVTWMALSLEGPGLRPLTRSLARHGAAAEGYWRDRWTTMRRKVGPAMDALPAPRRRLFARAWLTTATCRWMRENFVARPFYSAEGIDGGSVCSYLWDLSYASAFIARLEGRPLAGLIRRYLDEREIFRGYSISPLDGQWLGVFYAFSPYALTRIVADYVKETGDLGFLRRALPPLERILLEFDRRWRTPSGLLDFGNNRHLIELHTAGYQGLVPNPNFEHAWSLQTLNRLRVAAGLPGRPACERRVAQILAACNRHFWNERAGWFFPAQQRGKAGVWSIQVLSALRLGLFSPEQVARMAGHIRDGRFLGPCGLYSIAKDDELHFTLNDIDWGGDGCFCGHTGIVIEGFARYGMQDVVDRILDRIQWWADDLPYIPQETRADAPSADHGRPNLVSAGAICEALLATQSASPAPPKRKAERSR